MPFFKLNYQIAPQSIFSRFECHFFSDEFPRKTTLAEILHDPSATHLQDEIVRQLGKQNSLENWYFLHDLAQLETKSRNHDISGNMPELIAKYIDPSAKHEINISDLERNMLLAKHNQRNLTISDFLPAIKTVFYESIVDNIGFQALNRLRAAELVTQITQYEKEKPSFLNRLLLSPKAGKSSDEVFDLNASKLKQQLIDLLKQETKRAAAFDTSFENLLDSFHEKMKQTSKSAPSHYRRLFEATPKVAPARPHTSNVPDPRKARMSTILNEITSVRDKAEIQDIKVEFKTSRR